MRSLTDHSHPNLKRQEFVYRASCIVHRKLNVTNHESRTTIHERGMTLVELLLALTLFSALMASVTGLLRSGLQAQLRWGTGLVPYQAAERAFQRLEDDLEAAQPLFHITVIGETQRLEFARVTSQWVRIVYRISEEEDGTRWLVREEFAWDDDTQPLQTQRVLQVLNGSFAFGLVDAQDQLLWEASWDGQTQGIPRLVKLACAIPASGSQGVIELERVIRSPAGALPEREEIP